MQSARKKSLRKRKRRRELQKKWNERKRRKNTSRNIESSENNEEDSHTQVTYTESPWRVSIREKETEAVPSTSKQQEKVYGNLPEETPLYKPKVRFKQTKLNFQTNQTTNSTNSVDKSPSIVSKLHNKLDKKKPRMAPLGTSTPLPRSTRNSRKISSSSSLEIENITNIKTLKQTADKLNDNENSHLTNKKIVKRKIPKSSQGTITSIGSVSRLRTVKTDQRHIRSKKNKNTRK